MSYNTVLFAVEAGVATLTFNRPEQIECPECRNHG